MLKIGTVYKPKKTIGIARRISFDTVRGDLLYKDDAFIVLEHPGPRSGYIDYVILYKGEKWFLCLEFYSWSAQLEDFEVVC